LFQSLFAELSDQECFSLDDMSTAMVMNNLAASCGRMGDAALERSTREDRTRDPLYNQSKMYSELFRALGWVTSSEKSRLRFYFTTLGAYVAEAGTAADDLVKLCIVGIAFPNPVLDIKFETSVRPFVCILRAMLALDGIICRDEIILGPMSIRNDRDPALFRNMIEGIRSLRRSRDLSKPLHDLLRERKIAKTTSENYTRFPLGVLKWSQWATTCELNIYRGRAQRFYKLTSAGKKFLTSTQDYDDIRANDVEKMDPKLRTAFVENSFYNMLNKSNFDLSPIRDTFNKNEAILQGNNIDSSKTFFSPFQEMNQIGLASSSEIPVVFHSPTNEWREREKTSIERGHFDSKIRFKKIHLTNTDMPQTIHDTELSSVWQKANGSIEEAALLLSQLHENDNKDIFYPLVAKLFSTADFPCQTSRTGVNYQRWDASIELNGYYIPIEIKSPGEEKQLSVKAIRQAVENHIILLSRLPERSKPNHTSLAVGYQYPNDRAEVSELIDNVYNAFGFNIGVLDFKVLAMIAFANAFTKQKMSPCDLESLHGFLDINS